MKVSITLNSFIVEVIDQKYLAFGSLTWLLTLLEPFGFMSKFHTWGSLAWNLMTRVSFSWLFKNGNFSITAFWCNKLHSDKTMLNHQGEFLVNDWGLQSKRWIVTHFLCGRYTLNKVTLILCTFCYACRSRYILYLVSLFFCQSVVFMGPYRGSEYMYWFLSCHLGQIL